MKVGRITLHSYAVAHLTLCCSSYVHKVHRYYPSVSVRNHPRRSYDCNKFDILLHFGFTVPLVVYLLSQQLARRPIVRCNIRIYYHKRVELFSNREAWWKLVIDIQIAKKFPNKMLYKDIFEYIFSDVQDWYSEINIKYSWYSYD